MWTPAGPTIWKFQLVLSKQDFDSVDSVTVHLDKPFFQIHYLNQFWIETLFGCDFGASNTVQLDMRLG